METLKILLLLTFICIKTACSLSCYTCTAQNSNEKCMTASNCTAGEDKCQTSVVSVKVVGVSVATINKFCTSSCTPSSTSILGALTSVTCCSTDLCNISGAASTKSSYAMLALCMAFALALLRNSL